MKVDWAVQCMRVGAVGTFCNESRQGIVAQQERVLEARRETTLVFFFHIKAVTVREKKLSGATAVVLKTARQSCETVYSNVSG